MITDHLGHVGEGPTYWILIGWDLQEIAHVVHRLAARLEKIGPVAGHRVLANQENTPCHGRRRPNHRFQCGRHVNKEVRKTARA